MSEEKRTPTVHDAKNAEGNSTARKESRLADQSRTAHLDSKANDEKTKLDLRIGKLLDQAIPPSQLPSD